MQFQAPFRALNEPLGHSAHADEPRDEYLPAVQAEQFITEDDASTATNVPEGQ